MEAEDEGVKALPIGEAIDDEVLKSTFERDDDDDDDDKFVEDVKEGVDNSDDVGMKTDDMTRKSSRMTS